jgi:hypothetical protein
MKNNASAIIHLAEDVKILHIYSKVAAMESFINCFAISELKIA